ncbi:MAG: hypothetical protein ACYS7Y_12010 [Planctomycetota bacterium]|jgi:hypothetical protein
MNEVYGQTNWANDDPRGPLRKKLIKRGDVTFHIHEKSIRIVGPFGCGSSLVFYGRAPESKDIDHLCMLISMGCKMQLAHIDQVNTQAEKDCFTNCMEGK